MSCENFDCMVMGSIAGLVSSPMFSVYAATKAALCRFIESINIELNNDFELSTLLQQFSSMENLVVLDDNRFNIYPLNAFADNKDEVFIGRIRRDYSVPYGLNIWVVADNIRKGAASNAVQILEKLINQKEEQI